MTYSGRIVSKSLSSVGPDDSDLRLVAMALGCTRVQSRYLLFPAKLARKL